MDNFWETHLQVITVGFEGDDQQEVADKIHAKLVEEITDND
jgi:hypothetical protein